MSEILLSMDVHKEEIRKIRFYFKKTYIFFERSFLLKINLIIESTGVAREDRGKLKLQI